MSDQINDELSRLENEVNKYNKNSSTNYKYNIYIFGCIFFLIILIKPGFICNIDKKTNKKTINYKKLLFWNLFIIVVLYVLVKKETIQFIKNKLNGIF